MDPKDMVTAFAPVLGLVGLLMLAAFWITRRVRVREFIHRERMAMIEKGMIPPAELFPGGPPASILESAAARPGTTPPVAATRFRSIGIMLVGLGTALGSIIGLAAGEPNIGLGIGGAIAAMGAAMVVNGVLTAREAPAAPPVSPPPRADAPGDSGPTGREQS